MARQAKKLAAAAAVATQRSAYGGGSGGSGGARGVVENLALSLSPRLLREHAALAAALTDPSGCAFQTVRSPQRPASPQRNLSDERSPEITRRSLRLRPRRRAGDCATRARRAAQEE